MVWKHTCSSAKEHFNCWPNLQHHNASVRSHHGKIHFVPYFKFGYLKEEEEEDLIQWFYFKLEGCLMDCPSDAAEVRTETALLPSVGSHPPSSTPARNDRFINIFSVMHIFSVMPHFSLFFAITSERLIWDMNNYTMEVREFVSCCSSTLPVDVSSVQEIANAPRHEGIIIIK